MTKKRALLFAVVLAAVVAVMKLRTRKAPTPPAIDEVDEWGEESFPASDPPAHW